MMHEVHITCRENSRKLARLRRTLPDLCPNIHCDPNNIPAGSLCYEYPRGREAEFEQVATTVGLGFEWGILPVGDSPIASYALGARLYAITATKFRIWSIWNPASPAFLGELSLVLTPPTDLWISESVAVICYHGRLDVINIDNPAAPFVMFTFSTSQNWDRIRAVMGLAYLTGVNSGLSVVDYNEENDMDVIDFLDPTNSGFSSVMFWGRRLYFADTALVSGTSFLRNVRVGGFYCHAVRADTLAFERGKFEEAEGRHVKLKGAMVAQTVTAHGGGDDGGVVDAANYIQLGSVLMLWGSGSPEGVYTASVGSTFHRTDGGAGTSFYVKESGTGNTGWIPK